MLKKAEKKGDKNMWTLNIRLQKSMINSSLKCTDYDKLVINKK